MNTVKTNATINEFHTELLGIIQDELIDKGITKEQVDYWYSSSNCLIARFFDEAKECAEL